MRSLTGMSAHPQARKAAPSEAPGNARGDRVHQSGMLLVGVAVLILALVTANECHSITHLPSLLYGFTLWGWWGFIAVALWKIGPRMPALLRLSPPNMTLHLIAGCGVATLHLLLLGSLGLVVPEWRTNAPAITVL